MTPQQLTSLMPGASALKSWRTHVLLLARAIRWQVDDNALLPALPLNLCPEHVLELLALLPGFLQAVCFQLCHPGTVHPYSQRTRDAARQL